MIHTVGYGLDEYCDEARIVIKELCQAPQAEVHFLMAGTQTNLVSLSAFLRPHHAIIATDTAHICEHETGAIEATGHKVILVPSHEGKVCPDEIAALVRRLGMQDQVLIKTGASEENFARVQEVAYDLPYMVIARDRDDFTDELLKRPMRYVGVEALFEREDAPIASEDYLSGLRKKNLLAWGNAIVYDYRAVLTAGHADDISISEDPEKGWGWLVKRGFNIIQTDWTLDLARYLGR